MKCLVRLFLVLPGLLIIGVFSSLLLSNLLTQPIVDQSYLAGRHEIREKIYQRGSGWPDYRYERIYVLQDGRQQIELARFENESKDGIEAAVPRVLGEWVTVFSANHLILWKSGSKPIVFTPYRAVGWQEYAKQGLTDINGHYDYYARDFRIVGDRWLLEYHCANQPCSLGDNNQPLSDKLVFFSDDQGQTFYVQFPEK